MADALKDTQSTQEERSFALTYVDSTPVWDFGADLVSFALVSKDGKLMVPVLRQHTDPQAKTGFSKAVAAALKHAISGIKLKGDNIELPELNEAPLRDFVDTHFDHFIGVSSDDYAVHVAWLNQRPFIKERIFKEGVQGISYENPEVEDFGSDFIFDIMESDQTREVELFQKLFSPEKMRVETVYLKHVLKEVTDSVYQKYRKATVRQLNARQKRLTSFEDYNLMVEVYDELVLSIDGAVVNGAACNQKNKASWINLIPLDHKLLVLAVLMREIEGKNV